MVKQYLIVPVSSLLQLPGTVHSTSHRDVDRARYLTDRGWTADGDRWRLNGGPYDVRAAVELQQEIQRIAELKAMGF